MKKFYTILMILVLSIAILPAGALPFGLETDFTIEDLILGNFDLSSEDGLMEITPPRKSLEKRDRIIDDFMTPDIAEMDSWLIAFAETKDENSYEDAYNYIANELGEGTSENNTRFYIDRYSEVPDDETLMLMLFSGDLGDYLSKAMPTLLIKEQLEDDDSFLERCNMWVMPDITVYTLSDGEENLILYVHTEIISDFISTVLEMLFAEGLDSF